MLKDYAHLVRGEREEWRQKEKEGKERGEKNKENINTAGDRRCSRIEV